MRVPEELCVWSHDGFMIILRGAGTLTYRQLILQAAGNLKTTASAHPQRVNAAK